MNAATKTATHSVVTDQQLLDAFLEHIPDCVYFKDRDSRFVRISRALADRFGLKDPLEAVNKTDSDMFSSEHADQAFADEQNIIRTGQPIVCKEEKETWRDGRETWVSTTKVPLRNREGEIIGTMGISRDITERRVAELELQQYELHLEELVAARTSELTAATEQLERDIAARKLAEQELACKALELDRSNKDLEKFAYVASHDLQEPLRMVASYTQLLARRYKGKLGAEADDFINFAVDGANRMKQLIQDLLAYSRLSTRGASFAIVDSQDTCKAAITNLHQAIADAGAVLTVDSLPIVLADASQLTQLFQNLIGNAIKYCGDRIPEIRVTARNEGADWIFTVSDKGIGIEPQYFERIFEMFQRLHTRKEYAGTGIGLAICRNIVERHGGKLWVESQLGEGSKFIFTMPQQREQKK